MTHIFKFIVALLVVMNIGFIASAPFSVSASSKLASFSDIRDSNFGLDTAFDKSGAGRPTNKSIGLRVGEFLQLTLGMVALLSLVVVIYGGALWMTARGNEEQAGQGRNVLQYAVIGVVVAFSAYAVMNFVVKSIENDIIEKSQESVGSGQNSQNGCCFDAIGDCFSGSKTTCDRLTGYTFIDGPCDCSELFPDYSRDSSL